VQGARSYRPRAKAFVIKSSEWARPRGCFNDLLTFSVTSTSGSFSASSTVCDTLKLGSSFPSLFTVVGNPSMPLTLRVVARDSTTTSAVCDASTPIVVVPDTVLDYTIGLSDSGDGAAPTTLYVGTKSVSLKPCQ
jgi:hypothetical protein